MNGLFTHKSVKDSVCELHSLFETAENVIKTIERLQNEGIVVPSLNELRYTSYHLLRALKNESSESGGDDSFTEQMSRAKKHCKRAIYDAIEIGLIDRLEAIELFKTDYRMVDVTSVISDYIEMMGRAREAKNLVDTTPKEDRELYYEVCISYLDILIDITLKLEDARPELNKKIRSKRNGAFIVGVTIIIGLIGIAVKLI